jgi:hypothetical protein
VKILIIYSKDFHSAETKRRKKAEAQICRERLNSFAEA